MRSFRKHKLLLGFSSEKLQAVRLFRLAGMSRSSNSETPKAHLTLSTEPEMTPRYVLSSFLTESLCFGGKALLARQ